MPKRDIGLIAHSALTNHRIPRRPGERPAAAGSDITPEAPDLVHVNRVAGRPLLALTLMQAYGQLMEQRPAYAPRFEALLDAAKETDGDDPLVLAMLGRRALRTNAVEQAIRYLTRSIERGSVASSTYEDLGEALARAGRHAEAMKALLRGIELAPLTPELYKSLALRYIALRQREDAKRTLERYLDLFPQDDFIRGLLARVSQQ